MDKWLAMKDKLAEENAKILQVDHNGKKLSDFKGPSDETPSYQKPVRQTRPESGINKANNNMRVARNEQPISQPVKMPEPQPKAAHRKPDMDRFGGLGPFQFHHVPDEVNNAHQYRGNQDQYQRQ